jgi:hypothetical protein
VARNLAGLARGGGGGVGGGRGREVRDSGGGRREGRGLWVARLLLGRGREVGLRLGVGRGRAGPKILLRGPGGRETRGGEARGREARGSGGGGSLDGDAELRDEFPSRDRRKNFQKLLNVSLEKN